MLQAVKLASYRAARTAGLFSLAGGTRWRRNRLAILCYHGISLDDEHEWFPALYLTAEVLRDRLEALRRCRCNILPLDEAIARLQDGSLPERAVALTFDDGFYDFYRHAAPALREFGAAATVYVTTYYTGFQRPVFDPMMDYMLWKGRGRKLEWPDALPSPVHLDDTTRMQACTLLKQYARDRQLSAAEKDSLLAQLAEQLGLDYQDFCRRRLLYLMNTEELSSIRSQGFDLQYHTHRHRVPRVREPFQKELTDNRAALAEVGRPAEGLRHFCYPSGEYYSEFAGWLREAGVLSATTCDPGLAGSDTDPYFLPRYSDQMNIPGIVFEAWITGAASWMPHRTPRPGGGHV